MIIQLISFETTLSLLSSSSIGLPLFGACTRLGISPPYARRRAVRIGIRIHLLSAVRLVRSPKGMSGTPYACNPARCCTCGTPSSLRPCRACIHRQRSDGDAIPSSFFKDRVASGVVEVFRCIEDRRVRLHQPRSRWNISRLTDYILVCYRFPSVTCISIA